MYLSLSVYISIYLHFILSFVLSLSLLPRTILDSTLAVVDGVLLLVSLYTCRRTSDLCKQSVFIGQRWYTSPALSLPRACDLMEGTSEAASSINRRDIMPSPVNCLPRNARLNGDFLSDVARTSLEDCRREFRQDVSLLSA